MLKKFRIHGDNIVECERIAKLIINEVKPNVLKISLISPSTIVFYLDFIYYDKKFVWQLELLPGFNKSGRKHWENDIFDILKNNGSFLNETPDALVTVINGKNETILYAIEFCSALQAGNQAWQRSGRAYSTGYTGCPYLYVVDFVKYELDKNRKRKALRFPNPAVPYSYINYERESKNFVAQVYVRSEEFDINKEIMLNGFDENNFAEKELSAYIVKRMCGFDTSYEEKSILYKNFNIVLFLAEKFNSNINFSSNQWEKLYKSNDSIIKFAVENAKFNFQKIITKKGHHGKSSDFLNIIKKYSVGLSSRDLPFGIIPAVKRKYFIYDLERLYPMYNKNILNKMASENRDLVLCIIKGFKPHGDDNRPDRGILPFAKMLSSRNSEIMTYIYGPIINKNFKLLITNPEKLADINGLWRSILTLSDYVALDVPIINGEIVSANDILDTTSLKEKYNNQFFENHILTGKIFSNIPQEYHEDDVDTGIHFLFAHIFSNICFEGMCNPPGGDWSGLSILYNNYEYRWLSLPRISSEIKGKRPDHVLEIFGLCRKPILLSIESKECSINLETNVGVGLINYIKNLMRYVPNVKRNYTFGTWEQATEFINLNEYIYISAAAYLKDLKQTNDTVFCQSKCDMLFIMEPKYWGWNIEIATRTKEAEILKNFIKKELIKNKSREILII